MTCACEEGKGEARSDFPFAIGSVDVYKPLNKLFDKKEGWVGADGAYSIALDDKKAVWTFGDTWIGVIKGGKRIKPKMVNNTVGVQNLGDKVAEKTGMQFFWPGGLKKPDSVWIPEQEEGKSKSYYWPGDGAAIGGKLFVFLHKIRTNLKLPPPFQFETVGDDLVVISNPLDAPADWQSKRHVLSSDSKSLHFATACLAEGDYLYIYSNYMPARKEMKPHPLVLGRIKKTDLLAGAVDRVEYWLKSGKWSRELKEPYILFEDAAPEMSVSRLKGFSGYFAVYMAPLTKEIYLRHSEHPQGPFSKPVLLYDCPEKDDSIILYSAKAHMEQGRSTQADGEFVITYCRNTRSMQDHIDKPEIYFPQALLVKLEKKSKSSN